MRQGAQILALENAVNVAGGTPVGVGGIRSKEHQPAAGDIDAEGVDLRHSVASSQINDQFAMHTRQPMGNKHTAKAREVRRIKA
jgi:hypothetical protein